MGSAQAVLVAHYFEYLPAQNNKQNMVSDIKLIIVLESKQIHITVQYAFNIYSCTNLSVYF